MATVTNEQFLLSCINNSDLTKVDYTKVTKELGLPSAGAATKRWSRWKTKILAELTKSPDAAADGDSGADDATSSPKKAKKTPTKKAAAAKGAGGSSKKASAKKTPAKKRKLEEVAEEDEGGAVKDEADEA